MLLGSTRNSLTGDDGVNIYKQLFSFTYSGVKLDSHLKWTLHQHQKSCWFECNKQSKDICKQESTHHCVQFPSPYSLRLMWNGTVSHLQITLCLRPHED